MASVSVNVTGISAKATLPAPIEENGGAFTENTFAESPLSSENSNPYRISVSTEGAVSVTGLAATASVGSATVSLPTSISVTGVQATMPVVSIDSGGSLFGGIAFAEEPFSELEDSGLKIVIQTGTGVSVTGVAATGAVGSVVVNAKANVSVTGISATGAVGSATVSGKANVSVTGLAATSAAGSVTVTQGSGLSVTATGSRAIGRVGVATANGEITVLVTGVAATGGVGSVNILTWNKIEPNQTANWVEIAA